MYSYGPPLTEQARRNGAARYPVFVPYGTSPGSTSATKKRTVADGANERGRRKSIDATGWSRPILVRSLELPARLLRAENSPQPTPPHGEDAHQTPASKPAVIVMGALVRAPKAVSGRGGNRQHRARVLDCIQNEEYMLSSKSAEA
jgi:hypothetical protein